MNSVNIKFINCSSMPVTVRVGSQMPAIIQPNFTLSIACPKSDRLEIAIRGNSDGGKKGGKYTLALETNYTFFDVKDGDVFKITREKARVNSIVYYDRLFMRCDSAVYLSETHRILNEEKLKKSFKKSRVISFLLFQPLEYLPGLVAVLLILGVILAFKFGWKFSVVYFPLAYLFVLALNWLSDTALEQMFKEFKKRSKYKNEKEEFYECFENSFIASYYSDPNREPFLGEAEY